MKRPAQWQAHLLRLLRRCQLADEPFDYTPECVPVKSIARKPKIFLTGRKGSVRITAMVDKSHWSGMHPKHAPCPAVEALPSGRGFLPKPRRIAGPSPTDSDMQNHESRYFCALDSFLGLQGNTAPHAATDSIL